MNDTTATKMHDNFTVKQQLLQLYWLSHHLL